MEPRITRVGLLLLAACFAVLMVACDKEEKVELKPWVYTSEKAPYSVTMPPDWLAEDPKQFNSYADFAARKGQLHLIVIPQKLPRLAGAAPPDALALKRAAVSVMEESIDDLKVLKQGPIAIDGLDGHTVFANGKVEGQEHHYITTYTTVDEWGFQIVAWAPSDKERALTAEIDGLLDDWNFRRDESQPPTDPNSPTDLNEDGG